MVDFEKLSVFRLSHGAHDDPSQGLCAMEAVAWLEGLEHSDHPECTCPVIAAFVRSLNDNLSGEDRQRLVAYLPKLVGTVDPENEVARAEYLAWQAIRVFAPMALDAAGLHEFAEKLRGATDLSDAADGARAAVRASDAARAAVRAARAAVRAARAASDAARAAVRAADGAALAASYAADAAARAADGAALAASYAADAAARAAVLSAFKCLDGLLMIGRQANRFTRNTEEAVEAYRQLVSV